MQQKKKAQVKKLLTWALNLFGLASYLEAGTLICGPLRVEPKACSSLIFF